MVIAIYKEMKDVSHAFKKLENGDIVLVGYQQVNCHMVLTVR